MNADKRGYDAINLRSSAFICGFFFINYLRLFEIHAINMKSPTNFFFFNQRCYFDAIERKYHY